MGAVDPKLILEGVIAWMRTEGFPPTRTRLMKFLYLADLHWARFHPGETATGWDWKVDSFGPLATAGLALMDEGERTGWLRVTTLDRDDDPRSAGRAKIYDLVDGEERARAISAMPAGFVQLRAWIRRYGDDTGQLLRFVYGNTEPMEGARPGDLLDFTDAQAPTPAKPIPGRPFAPKQLRRLKELMTGLSATYATNDRSATADARLYDTAFEKDMPSDDPAPAGELLLAFDAEA